MRIDGRLQVDAWHTMIDIERDLTLPYSAEQLFDLINDVERYPEFISVCRSVRVLHRSSTETRAAVDLAGMGMKRQMITHNEYQRPCSMRMRQVSGPFSKLVGTWLIEPGDELCVVRAQVTVALGSRSLTKLARTLAPGIADQLVAALCRRAHALYGTGKVASV